MNTYAVIDSTNTVVNIVLWDGVSPWTPESGFTAAADSTPPSAQLGYIYNATATPPFAAPPTANVTANVTT